MIRCVIVDDEPLARASIRVVLEEEDDIEVVAECDSGGAAVQAIGTLHPDLVFLDIQMPDADGFQVIDAVGPDRMSVVVFVTAFDAHALRAFDVHAVDYVLKPFEDTRLREAVGRARMRLQSATGDLASQLNALVDTVRRSRGQPYASRIMVKDDDRIRFVRTDRIDYLEAARNKVRIHVGDHTYEIRSTLRGLSQRLDPSQFIRIHRSTVVNLDRVAEVQPWFGGDYLAILQNGTQLKVSRGCRDRLLRPTL